MVVVTPDGRVELVARLTAAFGSEIDRRDPGAAIAWPALPTVRAMVAHVGIIHRWVTEIVRTGEPVPEGEVSPEAATRGWYEEGRSALLDALVAVPPEEPCWIIGGRVGTVAFWRRRMVFENVIHLMDVRASGGAPWEAAPELTAGDYADGIDELLTEFLPRSKPTLQPLPGAIVLAATDAPRSWRISGDWAIDAGAHAAGDESARLEARASDVALMLWERADPLQPGSRFRVEGSPATVVALRSASIHPW
jgi:uncharacterized protein (TIGR03083 family)